MIDVKLSKRLTQTFDTMSTEIPRNAYCHQIIY